MKMHKKLFVLQILEQPECTIYLSYIKHLTLNQHLD